MIYDWHLMTHRYFVCTKLMFCKAVLFRFSLIEQLFAKKLLFRTCTLRGEKWCTSDLWWLIYMLCEQNWCFLKHFCVNFHYRKFFPGLKHKEGKKWRTIYLWWLIVILCALNWCFVKQFRFGFHLLNNFLLRNFSPGRVH